MMKSTFEKTPVNAVTWTVPGKRAEICEGGGRSAAFVAGGQPPIYYGASCS